MLNDCLKQQQIPNEWRKAKVVALLKPGNDPESPKSYRPIALLCSLYKLLERMILTRLQCKIEHKLIPQQAGFRPGKSCCSQVLNLTQHIEDGFELGQITGAAFIDLTAAYDTINHRRLLAKLVMLTDDVQLTKFIRTMLSNRRFKVELNGKQSRWRNQRNGLPQGSVLSPLLFNVYTNDQPLPVATNSFIYADDLCLTTQQKTFEHVETTLASGLNELGAYYKDNHLRPNPAKTQLTAFHLKNRQADRKLNVTWNGTKLDHTNSPVYLGITLDRSLTYRNHCMKTRAKLSSRNNLLRKLHGTNWGACPHTMRTTATALCLSVAEYCCPVWARSIHRKLVDTTLNETCRLITGCIRPTATPDLYVLSGIAPPEIRRSVHSQNERTKQLTDQRHSLHHHQPVKSRLHSRNSFVSSSQPLLCKPAEARIAKWQEQWEQTDSNLKRYNIDPKERLPSGHTLPWRAWRTSNRVRSGQAATPAAKHLWGYRDSKNCMCGAATCDLNHIMTSCTHFGERPSLDDIAEMKDGYVRWLRAIADTI